MYPDWVGPATAGFLALWLMVLSFLIWKQNNFLKSLFPRSGERDIRKKFEEVLKDLGIFREDLDKIKKNLANVENAGLGHIQRIELLRYNPYDDTGGDQSFSVSLLDNKGSGVVITSLHARSGTRIFAKPISLGKSGKGLFSKEEAEVIKKALE